MIVKGNKLIREDIKNILLIQLGDIGDVVLSFPCIRALKENFPKADVIVTVREKARELIEDCPWATGVISVDKKKRRFYKGLVYQKNFFIHLRKLEFDIAIDLRRGTRGAILSFLSGARQRIGFMAYDEPIWRNKIFTHLASPEEKPGQYVAERYLNLLFTYNIKTKKIWPELIIPEEKLQKITNFFKAENVSLDRPVIVIQPFSLWAYKEWGIDKYIDLINRMNEEYKLAIIIAGSSDERERADEIIKNCGRHVHNFAGKTSIGMFAAMLKSCKLFVGGDSAGIHIAAATGTPTVSIFGPSSSDDWAPRGSQHRVVEKNFKCVPCFQKGCHGSEISRCLDELTVDEVIPAVKSQIDKIFSDL